MDRQDRETRRAENQVWNGWGDYARKPELLTFDRAGDAELYGNTARYFDPYDYDTDLDKLAAQPVAAPDEVLQRYSWDRTANFWLHEIEKYAKM